MARRGGALIAGLVAAVSLAACGGDDKSFGDQRITGALHLVESEGGDTLQLAGDPFCIVETTLLNDSDEVEEASDDSDELVVASDEGNVGVVGTFVPRGKCGKTLRKRLNKLDPAPKED